jgi:hypothetical protein
MIKTLCLLRKRNERTPPIPAMGMDQGKMHSSLTRYGGISRRWIHRSLPRFCWPFSPVKTAATSVFSVGLLFLRGSGPPSTCRMHRTVSPGFSRKCSCPGQLSRPRTNAEVDAGFDARQLVRRDVTKAVNKLLKESSRILGPRCKWEIDHMKIGPSTVSLPSIRAHQAAVGYVE